MILGVSTYAVPWSMGVCGYPHPEPPLSLYGFLDLAAECSISLVQIGDNCPVESMTAQEHVELRKALEQRKLSVEVATRGTNPEHLMKHLEICRTIGARLCRTVVTSKNAMDSMNELLYIAEMFQESDVRLAIENHGLHTAEELKHLLEVLNHPAVGSCVDTTNSFSLLEGPEQVLTTLLPLSFNVHIKQFEIHRVRHQMGFELNGAPADSGQLDIPKTLSMIENCGRSPTVILEQWVPFAGDIGATVEREINWFRRSVEYLMQFPVW